jgi:uncharacterized protein YraI
MANKFKLFLVTILTIVTVGLVGFISAQPVKAQSGGCSISSFSMDPTPQYSLGVAVILSGTSNCGTVKFEILQGSNVVRTLSEIGQPNQTATWNTSETGSGNFDVCFVARGNGGWDQANRNCRAVYVEGSSGPPPGSEQGDNVRCWVNNLVVTPSSAPVGHTFNFSGQGQCDGNLRAVRFTVAGSPHGEFGGNTTSATWNSSGRGTGDVRICFQATAGNWSQAAESCTTITLTAENTQPSSNTAQGAPATNNQPPQTDQSNPNTFPPADPLSSNDNSSSNGSTESSSSNTGCSSSFGLTTGIRARVMLDPPLSNRMRSGAGTSHSEITMIGPGEEFDIIGGPSCANGYVWWQIRYNNQTGWTVEGSDGQAWIERVGGSSSNTNISGSSNNTSGSSGETTLLTSCSSNHGLATNIRARVTLYPAYHNNVRSNPGTDNTLLFQVAPGEEFDIIGGPRCIDGFVWWRIRFNNQTGWMVEGTSSEAWIERFSTSSGNSTDSDIPQLIDSGPLGSISLYENGTMRARIDYRVLVTYVQSGSDVTVRTITVRYYVDPVASARVFCWAAVTADLQDSSGDSLRINGWSDWSGWLIFVSPDEEASIDLTPFRSVGSRGVVDIGINFNCLRFISRQQIAEDSGSPLPPESDTPAFVRVRIDIP